MFQKLVRASVLMALLLGCGNHHKTPPANAEYDFLRSSLLSQGDQAYLGGSWQFRPDYLTTIDILTSTLTEEGAWTVGGPHNPEIPEEVRCHGRFRGLVRLVALSPEQHNHFLAHGKELPDFILQPRVDAVDLFAPSDRIPGCQASVRQIVGSWKNTTRDIPLKKIDGNTFKDTWADQTYRKVPGRPRPAFAVGTDCALVEEIQGVGGYSEVERAPFGWGFAPVGTLAAATSRFAADLSANPSSLVLRIWPVGAPTFNSYVFPATATLLAANGSQFRFESLRATVECRPSP
jgi:hypothetical protein